MIRKSEGELRLPRFSAAEAGGDAVGLMRGLNRLRKNIEFRAKPPKNIPQGLKPALILQGLCAG
jgi:hypothetical protein